MRSLLRRGKIEKYYELEIIKKIKIPILAMFDY